MWLLVVVIEHLRRRVLQRGRYRQRQREYRARCIWNGISIRIWGRRNASLDKLCPEVSDVIEQREAAPNRCLPIPEDIPRKPNAWAEIAVGGIADNRPAYRRVVIRNVG